MRYVISNLLALLVSAQTALAEVSIVERDSVTIESSIKSSLYTWKITNGGTSPIMRFEIPQRHTYNQQVPTGWNYSYDETHFIAWALEPQYAIMPRGGVGTFTARGSSAGAILGLRSASVGFDADSTHVQFADVWSPIDKPRSLVWLVVGVICALALTHCWLIRRRPVQTTIA